MSAPNDILDSAVAMTIKEAKLDPSEIRRLKKGSYSICGNLAQIRQIRGKLMGQEEFVIDELWF